jgi:hypothetical protein
MVSRMQMRDYQRAARQAWNTPPAERLQVVTQVREVIESSDATDREKRTAREVMLDLERAGWANTHAPT